MGGVMGAAMEQPGRKSGRPRIFTVGNRKENILPCEACVLCPVGAACRPVSDCTSLDIGVPSCFFLPILSVPTVSALKHDCAASFHSLPALPLAWLGLWFFCPVHSLTPAWSRGA